MMFSRIREFYWRLVPYHWRPGSLWYQFKCWAWKRYSTVRPRWLPHTWVDRDVLLAHCMFEILGQFLEHECGDDGIVDWDSDEEHRAAMAELRELWRWWTEEYLLFSHDGPLTGVEAPEIVFHDTLDGLGYRAEWKYSSPEAKEKWNAAVLAAADAEAEMEVELRRRQKRLVDISPYMWT